VERIGDSEWELMLPSISSALFRTQEGGVLRISTGGKERRHTAGGVVCATVSVCGFWGHGRHDARGEIS